MKEQTVQFNFRVPLSLREWLQDSADKNRRTATNELVIILEKEKESQEATASN